MTQQLVQVVPWQQHGPGRLLIWKLQGMWQLAQKLLGMQFGFSSLAEMPYPAQMWLVMQHGLWRLLGRPFLALIQQHLHCEELAVPATSQSVSQGTIQAPRSMYQRQQVYHSQEMLKLLPHCRAHWNASEQHLEQMLEGCCVCPPSLRCLLVLKMKLCVVGHPEMADSAQILLLSWAERWCCRYCCTLEASTRHQ